jgi:hypothetical protein
MSPGSLAHYLRFRRSAIFIHPIFSDFTFVCYRPDTTGVFVRSESVLPSDAWYSLAAKAGRSVTGVDTALIKGAIRKCHRDALEGGHIEIRMLRAKIRCHASPGDDAGAEIFINDEKAQ